MGMVKICIIGRRDFGQVFMRLCGGAFQLRDAAGYSLHRRSSWRRRIIPKEDISEVKTEITTQEGKAEKLKCSHPRPRRYARAELLKRVFAVDSLKCSCGKKMRILCAVNPPDAIRKILDCLGLPSRPPPIAPAVIRYEHGQPVP